MAFDEQKNKQRVTIYLQINANDPLDITVHFWQYVRELLL